MLNDRINYMYATLIKRSCLWFSDSIGFYNLCNNWSFDLNSNCWKGNLRNTYWRGKGVYLSNTMPVRKPLTLCLIGYFIALIWSTYVV